MTSKQITAVALKCLAIYLLFQAVVAFPMWILFARQVTDGEGVSPLATVVATAVIVIIVSAIAIGFAFLAWRLANRLTLQVTTPPVDDIHVNITPRRLEEILFRVLGVFLAVTHLQPLVGNVVRRQLMKAGEYSTSLITWDLLSLLMVLIFGLLLTFRPATVIDLLDRLTKKLRAPTDESTVTSDSAASDESESPHS